MSQDFIRVGKNGAYLSVHPTTLAAHQAAGWIVSDEQRRSDTDLDADPPDHDGDGKKGGSKAVGDGYEAMTVVELKAMASDRAIDLGDATKKADIIATLELADEAPAGGASETTPAAE